MLILKIFFAVEDTYLESILNIFLFEVQVYEYWYLCKDNFLSRSYRTVIMSLYWDMMIH